MLVQSRIVATAFGIGTGLCRRNRNKSVLIGFAVRRLEINRVGRRFRRRRLIQ